MQYGLFMMNLVRGDFGQSFYYQTPVLELYMDRLPNSLLLAAVAMAFSLATVIAGQESRFSERADMTSDQRTAIAPPPGSVETNDDPWIGLRRLGYEVDLRIDEGGVHWPSPAFQKMALDWFLS